MSDLLPGASLGSELLAQVTKNVIGERILDMHKTYQTNSRNAGRKARLKGFTDFLGSAARDYLFSNFSQIVMGAAMTMYTFDWNKTDKAIEEQIQGNYNAMASQAGRLTADGIIRWTGLGVTANVRHRYPTIDPSILATIDEENKEELIASIQGAIVAMRSAMQSNAMLTMYMSGRKLMGKSPTEKGEPWILSDQLDKMVEKNENPTIKAYLTGLKDQSEDAIFDLGFLVSNGVQSQYLMSQMAQKNAAGPDRVVKYTPDKSEPNNFTWLSGPTENIKTAINAAKLQGVAIATKDVGQIVASAVQTSMKATAAERTATCWFYSGVNGASTLPTGKRSSKKTLTISNIKLSTDWDKLKTYLKPVSGGPWKVVAHLDDGHQLTGFFVSEGEGKSYFNPIIQNICKGNLVKWSVIEPSSDIRLRPDVERFEIAKVHYLVTDETSDIQKKTYIDRNGKMYRSKLIKLKLNSPTGKPDGIDAILLSPWGTTT
jgi:hypothetical protein